jgi:thiol-disulfide isomerase/thioredoxin
MKKTILTLVVLVVMLSAAFAQTAPVSSISRRYKLDETTIVKDSSGKQYSYSEWTKMMASKNYNLIHNISSDSAGKPLEFLIRQKRNTDPPVINLTAGQNNGIQATRAVRIPAKPAESEQFHAGDVFKPFNEKDIDGQKFDLKKDKGKVYVVNFWFIGCPPCRAEIPDLNKIVEHYKDNKDVVFIAICLDEKYDIKNFLKLFPFNYHIIDDGRYVAAKYGVHLYPTNVVVNRDGKVAYSSVSNQSANPYWITKTIDEALAAMPEPAIKDDK